MMRHRWVCGVLPLFFVLGLIGCGGASPEDAEREVAARAPEIIGQADHYRADVTGVADGRVELITLAGMGVRPAPETLIDTLTLTLRGVEYQTQPFQITRVAEGTFTGRVSEAAVNHYLQRQQTPIGNTPRLVRVQIRRDTVTAVTAVKVMAVEFSLTTTGRVDAKDGLHINYVPERLEIMDIPVPAAARTLVVNHAYPLVDLTGLRFAPRLTKVKLEPGGLLLAGTAQLRGR